MSNTSNMRMQIPDISIMLSEDLNIIDSEFTQRATNVKWYDAKGDGITDDTLAIQNAINACPTNGIVFFPPGNYVISSVLKVSSSAITIQGTYNCSITQSDNAGTSNIFQIGDGVTQINSVFIRDIVLTRSNTAAAGSAIYVNYAGLIHIENVRIYGNNNVYQGITLYKCLISWVKNCYVQQCKTTGLYISGASNTAQSEDIVIDGCRFESNADTAINIYDFTQGVYIRNSILYNNGSGISISASAVSNALSSFFVQNTDIDSNNNVGIYINYVSDVLLTSNWISNNAGVGIQVATNASGVTISGGSQVFGRNGQRCIEIEGTGILIDGNYIASGTEGVYVQGTRVTVTNNDIGYQSIYGVNLGANPTSVFVHGNTLHDIAMNSILTGTGTNNRIFDNSGYNPVGLINEIIPTSGAIYTNSSGVRQRIFLTGGNLTSLSINGTTTGITTTPINFELDFGETFSSMYSIAPVMTVFGL